MLLRPDTPNAGCTERKRSVILDAAIGRQVRTVDPNVNRNILTSILTLSLSLNTLHQSINTPSASTRDSFSSLTLSDISESCLITPARSLVTSHLSSRKPADECCSCHG